MNLPYYDNKMKRLSLYSVVLFFMLAVFSCASESRERIQAIDNVSIQLFLARDLVYQYLYKDAEEMFMYIKKSHPDDVALQIEIDYEIAFIYLKRKKYNIAKEKFETLIAEYDKNQESDTWSQWAYYLSKSLLEKKILPHIKTKETKSKS